MTHHYRMEDSQDHRTERLYNRQPSVSIPNSHPRLSLDPSLEQAPSRLAPLTSPTNSGRSTQTTMPSIANPRKRPRISAACLACRQRRSRCDLIDSYGCHRCKQLGAACSFATQLSPSSQPTLISHSPPSASVVSEILPGDGRAASSSTVSNRHALVDTQVQESVDAFWIPHVATPTSPAQNQFDYNNLGDGHSISSSRVGGGSTLPAIVISDDRQRSQRGPTEESRDEAWFFGSADPVTFSLVRQGIKSKKEIGLRDPVDKGLITEGQAQAAYQLFKYHFAPLFPYSEILLVHSPLPSHPFLKSACLYFVSRCATDVVLFSAAQLQQLESVLVDNLNAYHFGCRPSLESTMAAFILSMITPAAVVNNSSLPEIDAPRLCGLAYGQMREMGHSDILERTVQALELKMPLRYLKKSVEDCRIFLSVINRHVWHSVTHCVSAILPSYIDSTQKRFLALLTEQSLATDHDRHLMFEHRLLDILIRYSQQWRDLEKIQSPQAHNINIRNDFIRSVMQDIEAVIEMMCNDDPLLSLPYLHAQAMYCKWWVSARNIWSIYRLPMPLLVDATYSSFIDALSLAAEASTVLLTTCLTQRWQLASFPKAIGTGIVLSFMFLSIGRKHIRNLSFNLPSLPSLEISDTLEAIQHTVSHSGDGLRIMLARACESIREYGVQLDLQDETTVQPQESSLGVTDDLFQRLVVNGQLSGTTDMLDMFPGIDTWLGWSMPWTEPLLNNPLQSR